MQLLLTWLMSADGNVTDKEMDFLDDAAPPAGDEAYLSEFLFMCEDDKYLEIQLACEYLREHLSPRAKLEFIRLAIGIILADGRFTYMERYILEFYADLFNISHDDLTRLFFEVKGVELPQAGDPSTKDWWLKHQHQYDERRRSRMREKQKQYASGNFVGGKRSPEARQALRARAYAILGLPLDAPRDQVRLAFRRLAQVHHPDRFAKLGPEAVKVAAETFNRIKKAQDFLLND